MAALACALAALGAGVVLLLSEDDGTARTANRDRGTQPAADNRDDGDAPDGPAAEPADAFDAHVAALANGFRSDAASALYRLIQEHRGARLDGERRLLDPRTPREIRMALALILGSLGRSDSVLIDALTRFADDADVVRCLLFGLGAFRHESDDELFDMGARPWGVTGPGELGITLHRSVADAATRQAIAKHLRDRRGTVREAAALALRHSVEHPGVISDFVVTLRSEPSDDVAQVLGETLAGWAGSLRSPVAEQTAVVDTLLARAADADLDGYRFKMEDDFRRVPLSAGQVATLVAYAKPAHSSSVRSFALSTLSHTRNPDARALLEDTLTGDDDTPMRDLAARLLGGMPLHAATVRALVAASVHDKAWNVRYQAVDALGRFPGDSVAKKAVVAAKADPDDRVAKLAIDLAAR